MFKFLFITCDEATMICDKSQYNEASLFEKIQLNIHFLRCGICRLYTKQNNKMSDFFRMKATDCQKEKPCLSDIDKAALKQKLENSKA
ncbi:hypothetical protein [Polaribacter marinivivus]